MTCVWFEKNYCIVNLYTKTSQIHCFRRVHRILRWVGSTDFNISLNAICISIYIICTLQYQLICTCYMLSRLMRTFIFPRTEMSFFLLSKHDTVTAVYIFMSDRWKFISGKNGQCVISLSICICPSNCGPRENKTLIR